MNLKSLKKGWKENAAGRGEKGRLPVDRDRYADLR